MRIILLNLQLFWHQKSVNINNSNENWKKKLLLHWHSHEKVQNHSNKGIFFFSQSSHKQRINVIYINKSTICLLWAFIEYEIVSNNVVHNMDFQEIIICHAKSSFIFAMHLIWNKFQVFPSPLQIAKKQYILCLFQKFMMHNFQYK